MPTTAGHLIGETSDSSFHYDASSSQIGVAHRTYATQQNKLKKQCGRTCWITCSGQRLISFSRTVTCISY